jgi:hypothetical protein
VPYQEYEVEEAPDPVLQRRLPSAFERQRDRPERDAFLQLGNALRQDAEDAARKHPELRWVEYPRPAGESWPGGGPWVYVYMRDEPLHAVPVPEPSP